MRHVRTDTLVPSLERKGFTMADRGGATRRLVRRTDDRHDHVELRLGSASLLTRLARRPRVVHEVVAGVVWPIGEMAFSRSVPERPLLPQQAHAVTSFESLVQADPADPAALAAALDDWCRRLEDPAQALEVGAITDAVRRLEFAVIASRGDLGRRAAEHARADARDLPAAPRRQAMKRIDLAEQRLPAE